MTARHDTEPINGTDVEISLDYTLQEPETLIGVHPDERHAEIRRQLLDGPLESLSQQSETQDGGVQSRSEISGQHNLNTETGAISGRLTLTARIDPSEQVTPDELLAGARQHFAEAMANDIDCGLGINLEQAAA